jgi:DeoR family fructose operon transcriptional repressor
LIRGILRDRSGTTLGELVEVLNVSAATVHRDLERLANSGDIIRVRGGAISHQELVDDPPVVLEKKRNTEPKRAIAREAVQHVVEGQVIFLEASSTVSQMVPLLRRFGELTVVTNDPSIAMDAVRFAEVVLIGGSLRRQTLATVGPMAESALSHVHVDVAFVGISAIDAEHGISSFNLTEAETKRQIINSADHVVGLADGSKVGRVGLAHVTSASKLQVLVTDPTANEDEVARLRSLGVVVSYAK